MAEPKSTGEDGAEAPYFPRPRKQEEPSPYRKAAAKPAIEPEKGPVVVSRPEPPVDLPVVEPRPRTKPKPAPRAPPIPVELAASSGSTPLSKVLARYPRLFGIGCFLLTSWLYGSAVLSDHQALRVAAYYGLVRTHKSSWFLLNGGLAAIGLWLAIWGIPMDEKTDRPRDIWTLGLFILVVLTLAGRSAIEAVVIALFA